MKHLSVFFAFIILCTIGAIAQPRATKVQLILVPDHADALYNAGEDAKFKITALDCGMPLTEGVIKWEVSEDLMRVHKTDSTKLNGTNETKINIGTMKKFGFLRVKASIVKDGKTYSSIATVGYNTDQLVPTVQKPNDFDAFWTKQVEAVRKVELKPIMTLLPDRCTDKVNVYHISYGNINGTRMYGILTMPATEGKYPAILRFPGAGVGEKGGDIAHAQQGVIVLELGIHGIPVNLSGNIYSELNKGALASYPTYNIDNKYSYYYKRVYMGCVRGVDFLLSLPQCNGRIGTLGGSQGGALSIITSALDNRVIATATYFPALCDLEGYTHHQAGGWPHVFKNEDNRTPEKLNTARYYDTANFARCLKAPVCYIFGYNDLTCAPTTTRATYNVITAPKKLIIGENIGHWLYPEQTAELWNWLIDQLKIEN